MESSDNKPMNLTDINDLRTCRDQLRLLAWRATAICRAGCGQGQPQCQTPAG